MPGSRCWPTSGCEGEQVRLTCLHEVATNHDRSIAERSFNRVRAWAEQGNAWSKNCRVLQGVTLRSWQIGVITAAVLVTLHLERGRTT